MATRSRQRYGLKATIPDRDLYAAAMLIRKHGEEAHSIATNRAEELKAPNYHLCYLHRQSGKPTGE